ncbi:MAG TPA: phosphoenolpyruvate--protein phosphotransferase [Candidatus Ozemobacteraceae bacterium]|nr:phosphoenolpyruvate--protein phosphotransferase [Candidatus Ozemobacteraceae bacterium]HQG27198.1 phosphoenolpyruvate--protein phosphotransferase [Candidatus Ozemobacteraceae bacterium]
MMAGIELQGSSMLKGLAISPGYALGRAHCLQHLQLDNVPATPVAADGIEAEVARFQNALRQSRLEISQLLELPQIKSSLEIANIFQAHQTLIDDPDLSKEVVKRIRDRRLCLESVLSAVIKDYSEFFRKLPDPQFQGKAIDIMDIGRRILRNCQANSPISTQFQSQDGIIIIAEDLTPSDIVGFDPKIIRGIAMSEGTATSHASILARSLGIPALIQVKHLLCEVKPGSFLIVDGNSGSLVVDPPANVVEEYQQAFIQFEQQKRSMQDILTQPATTRDGTRLRLYANIGQSQDVDAVLANQADGIGLYRTEFTYLIRRRFPTEEELLDIYWSVVERLGNADVVIRTIDLGGDKIPYLVGQSIEKNPELGWRAVRMALDLTDMFKTQLRAILRTCARSGRGNVRVLFPMISNLSELRRAKALLQETAAELKQDGVPVPEKIPVGTMIEVPSAALMAGRLVREVDFLSIGSNDLIQYTLAVDRTNSKVAHLYQPANPAVLRLIHEVVEAGAAAGKDVSLCGELAGDSRYTTLLLGLGLRVFSMNAVFIPRVKQIVRSVSLPELRSRVLPLLDLDTADEIEEGIATINAELGIL